MKSRIFGRWSDGSEILEVEIAGGGLSARVITWGAAVRDLRLTGHRAPLVLGLNSLEDYARHSRHFGAMAGRCANRIGAGRCVIGGAEYRLERNEDGRTHLHGGDAFGFSKRPWRLAGHDARSVTLALTAEDGEAGYPGRVETEVTYTIEPPATLLVAARATTDKPTLVNLAHHSYFNLGGEDIRGHALEVAAGRITELDELRVPTGRVLDVAGTPFDFREPLTIGARGASYDINFCLTDSVRDAPHFAARAALPDGGLALEVWTTEPGLQIYDAARLNCPVPGLEGRRYGAFAGLCLEAQRWPNAVNHPHFPSALLCPGEVYRQQTEYRFISPRI
ncbi:MAG: aldose epimerase family protein [Alphaproteobacteria bacterium]